VTSGAMRLQKYLARAGVASRRASEDLIRAGRVSVDGRLVTELGSRVDPERSVVAVDGRAVELSPVRWVALHKEPGTLCTRSDPRGRPTVYDALPGDLRELFHVGRLDYLSEGLLLLTNEGQVAHRLMHPSTEVEKRYEVGLIEPVPPGLARDLLAGVELEDGRAAADAASLLPPGASDGGTVLLVTLHEGRNREIRRMLEALGARVRYLRRLSVGPVELGDLPRGKWRELTAEERTALRDRVRRTGG
jgi:23S rRNA pseudouridine2605 synthase